MTYFLRGLLGNSSAAFGLVLMLSVIGGKSAIAAEDTVGEHSIPATHSTRSTDLTATSVNQSFQGISEYSNQDDPIQGSIDEIGSLQGQVTSVSQFSDVKPTDWAYQALQSLVERYGCIVGYPDKTYRGNRALSRYEFAAGLNACLDKIQELIAAATADFVKKEDLEVVKKLQEEFAAELSTLRGRVDALDVRTATLEKQQFSTTTKLYGNVVFALAGVSGDHKAVPSGVARGSAGKVDDQVFFSERVRLVLNSSFSGKDHLIIRLQAGNTPNLAAATGTNSAKLAFQDTGGNSFRVNQLEYRFPIGDKGTVFLEAFGFLDLFVPTLHPLDGDYDTVLTGFSLRSPIYFPSGVTGAGFNYNITDKIQIGGGYLAGDPTANNPATGLFHGPYGGLAQVTVRPFDKFAIALTYLHAYDDGSSNAPPGGFFGSTNATTPFGAIPTSTNGYGVEAQYSFSPKFLINGWYYYATAKAESGINKGDDATVQAWAVALTFPDLFKTGSLGGLIVGMPSKATRNDVSAFKDRSTSIQIEAFYKYMFNDRIGLTPGVIVITNPDQNSRNDTIFIGVLRTTFNF